VSNTQMSPLRMPLANNLVDESNVGMFHLPLSFRRHQPADAKIFCRMTPSKRGLATAD
jgi:hypothetical protein